MLLSLGAPQSLVNRALQASAEEITQARCCMALASGYATTTPDPARWTHEAAHPVSRGIVEQLIHDSIRRGCVDEGFAARASKLAQESCEEPYVRETLTLIAEDERKHEELGWDVLAWALSHAGDEGIDCALRVCRELPEQLEVLDLAATSELLMAHGRVPGIVQRQLYAAVRDEVIEKIAGALEDEAIPA